MATKLPTFEEYLKGLSKEDRIKAVMDNQAVDRDDAIEFLAIMLGESQGDSIALAPGVKVSAENPFGGDSEDSDSGSDMALFYANPFGGLVADLAVWKPEDHPRWPKGTPKKGGQFMPKGGLPGKFYTKGGQVAYTGTPSDDMKAKKHQVAIGIKQGAPTMVHSAHVSKGKLATSAKTGGAVLEQDVEPMTAKWDPATKTLAIDGGAKEQWQYQSLAKVYPEAKKVTIDGQDHTGGIKTLGDIEDVPGTPSDADPPASPKEFVVPEGTPKTFYTKPKGGQIGYPGPPGEADLGKKHQVAVGMKGDDPAMVYSKHISAGKLGQVSTSGGGALLDKDKAVVTGKWNPDTETLTLNGSPTDEQVGALKAVYGSKVVADGKAVGGGVPSAPKAPGGNAGGSGGESKAGQGGLKKTELPSGGKAMVSPSGTTVLSNKAPDELTPADWDHIKKTFPNANEIGKIGGPKTPMPDEGGAESSSQAGIMTLPSGAKAAKNSEGVVKINKPPENLTDADFDAIKKQWPDAATIGQLGYPDKMVPMPGKGDSDDEPDSEVDVPEVFLKKQTYTLPTTKTKVTAMPGGTTVYVTVPTWYFGEDELQLIKDKWPIATKIWKPGTADPVPLPDKPSPGKGAGGKGKGSSGSGGSGDVQTGYKSSSSLPSGSPVMLDKDKKTLISPDKSTGQLTQADIDHIKKTYPTATHMASTASKADITPIPGKPGGGSEVKKGILPEPDPDDMDVPGIPNSIVGQPPDWVVEDDHYFMTGTSEGGKPNHISFPEKVDQHQAKGGADEIGLITGAAAFGKWNPETKNLNMKTDPTKEQVAILLEAYPEAKTLTWAQSTHNRDDAIAAASGDLPNWVKPPQKPQGPPAKKVGETENGFSVYDKPLGSDELYEGGSGNKKFNSFAYGHVGKTVKGLHGHYYAGSGGPAATPMKLKKELWDDPAWGGKKWPTAFHTGTYDPDTNTVAVTSANNKPTKALLARLKADFPQATTLRWNGKTLNMSGEPKGYVPPKPKPGGYGGGYVSGGNTPLVPPSGKADVNKPGGHWPDLAQANKWFRTHFGDWQKSFTASESSAIGSYTGGGFTSLNKELRVGKGDLSKLSSTNKAKQKAIDSAMKKATPTPAETVTHRGRLPDGILKAFAEGNEKGLIGKEYGDNANVSTSIDYKTAKAFSGTSKPNWKNSIGTIKLPKGAKVGYVKGVSSHDNEDEIILPRGTKFKVTKAWIEPNGHYNGPLWRIEGEYIMP